MIFIIYINCIIWHIVIYVPISLMLDIYVVLIGS